MVEITDKELRIARQGALSAARSGRGLVDPADLIGEANLWMVEHIDKVAQWSEQGRHGQNKLRNACRQRCLTILAKERRLRSGLEQGDSFYYNAQMIRELLPDIFDEDDWASGSSVSSSEVRAPSRPAEGNNRLAMVADVRQAFFSLPQEQRDLLEALYKDGGMPIDAVAAQWDVSDRTIRRREERNLEKMVERLGGEAPWSR